MGLRNVPTSIKDPNLAGFLRELRAAVGGVSDQVTKLIQTKSSSGGGGGTDPGTNPPDPSKPPVGDGYPPPAPTSLQAIPAAFSVTLVWTNPVIADLQATEVWGRRSFDAWNASYEYLANAKVLVNGTVYRSRKAQDVNSTTNVVTLNKGFPPATSPTWWEATTLAPTDKSKIGESGGTSWIHDKLTPGETWAYWVRNRDIEDLYSTFFPADDIGVITTTLLDPKAYLDLLTNSITATQLYRDLGQRINLIDGPLTIQPSCSIAGHTTEAACKAAGGTWNPGSVAYRVAEEATARANGLAAEALARETGITNESTIRRTQDEQLAQTISVVNAKADNAAAAVISEQTARVTADGALGSRIDAVVATSNGNTAAITSEATARANADSALGTRIDTVVATTNTNTAAIQTEINARTTADSALSQRIDVVVAKADTNAAAITSEATARASADGTLGQRIDQVQAVGNNNSALITDVNQSKIGYCSIAGQTSEHGTRQACEAAGGTWNIGLPWANAVKQVSVTANNGQTASLQQQFEAIYGAGGLRAQYTVKIDNAGWVSGFGLSSETQSDGTVISDFGIRADRFWLAPPANPTSLGNIGIPLVDLGNLQVIRVVDIYPSAASLTSGSPVRFAYLRTNGASGLSAMTTPGRSTEWFTLKDIRSTPNSPYTQSTYWNQTWWPYWLGDLAYTNYEWFNGQPTAFTRYVRDWAGLGGTATNVIVMALPDNPAPGYKTTSTTAPTNDPPTLVGNKYLPFVVTTNDRYYNGQLIKAGVYMNAAWIVDASITNAKIYGDIRSIDYDGEEVTPNNGYGNAGWCINKLGRATFNNAVFRGNLSSTVSGSPTFDDAGNITSNGTTGWAITKAGNAIFNTVVVRSGANVGANALSWAKFYDGLTHDDYNIWTAFSTNPGSEEYVDLCWTPYTNAQVSEKIVVPYATNRTTTIVCALTFESPTKSLTVGSGSINIGSNDGVKLDLMNGSTYVKRLTLFEANGKDIIARFYSGQGAFVLTAAEAAGLTNPHIRVRVRHSNSGWVTYDNVRMSVQAFVS